MPVKNGRRAGGKTKSKSKKKSTPSSKRKTDSAKKKKTKQLAKKKTSKKKTKKNKSKAKKTEIDKAEIKKAVDEIPNLIAKEIAAKEPEEEQMEDGFDFDEEELKEIKNYFQPKKTFSLEIQPKKNARTKFIWIGVLSIAMVIFAMWIWNVWTMFYDVTEYKQGEKTAFWQDVRNDFNEAFESVKIEDKENENNLQKAAEEAEGKKKLEEVLGLLITELNNATSTTSTIDAETNTSTAANSAENTSSTLEKVKQILTDIN